MKIAISVPDPLYRSAEGTARRMRVPRDQFHRRAIEAYLRQTSCEDVTARLDEVHAQESQAPDPFLHAAAKATFRRTRW